MVAGNPAGGRRELFPLSIPTTKEIEINFGDLDHLFGFDAHAVLNHQVGELVPIDEYKAWITNALGKADGVSRELAGGDKDSFAATA